MPRWMKTLGRKCLQGLTVSVAAVAGAIIGQALLRLNLVEPWFDLPYALGSFDGWYRVGIPAFIAGVLFFPVNARTLAGRGRFAARAALAAAAVSLANRVLVWAPDGNPDSLWGGVWSVLSHPSLLLPNGELFLGLDINAFLGLSATLLAGVLAWAAQPMLLSIATTSRGRATRLPAVSALDDRAPSQRQSVSL